MISNFIGALLFVAAASPWTISATDYSYPTPLGYDQGPEEGYCKLLELTSLEMTNYNYRKTYACGTANDKR
jgi:hypothetical protein